LFEAFLIDCEVMIKRENLWADNEYLLMRVAHFLDIFTSIIPYGTFKEFTAKTK